MRWSSIGRDVVDLVGDHLDLFRRNQAAIGVDVMGTLSLEERDERLKHHLMASKELHPALISPECSSAYYGWIVSFSAKTTRGSMSPSPMHCSRACNLLVMQPTMNFANPAYINELIEYIFLVTKDDGNKEAGDDQSPNVVGRNSKDVSTPDDVPNEFTSRKNRSSYDEGIDLMPSRTNNQKEISLDASEKLNSNLSGEEPMQPWPADWARVLEAATQRRKEVLMPENLENMWTKGRNY